MAEQGLQFRVAKNCKLVFREICDHLISFQRTQENSFKMQQKFCIFCKHNSRFLCILTTEFTSYKNTLLLLCSTTEEPKITVANKEGFA